MIEAKHVVDMVVHWLETPVNGYFGSSYGADLNSLLLKPLATDIADKFVQKLKQDIPALQQVDVSIYSQNIGFEQKRIFLEIGKVAVLNLNDVKQRENANTKQEYVDANAE